MAVVALAVAGEGSTPDAALLRGAIARLAPRAPAGTREVEMRHARLWIGYTHAAEARAPQHVMVRRDDELFVLDGHLAQAGRLARQLELPPDASAAQIAWAVWLAQGAAGLSRLEGQFLALWLSDGGRRVQVARDPSGCRTLFYRVEDGQVFAASEAVAVCDLTGRAAQCDTLAAAHHFALRAPPGGHSFVAGVREVPAGAAGELSGGNLVEHAIAPALETGYWERATLAECAEAFGDAMRVAVRDEIAEARGAAISLSGGIDSTAIAAALREGEPAMPCSVVSWSLPQWPQCDEWPQIAATAHALQLRAHAVLPHEPRPLATNDVECFIDGPVGNPYRGIKRAQYDRARAEGAEVLLSGNFGDHLQPDPRERLREAVQSGDIGAALWRVFSSGGPMNWWRDPGMRGALSRWRRRRRSGLPPWLTAKARAAVEGPRARPAWLDAQPFPERVARVFSAEAALEAAADTPYADRAGIRVAYPYRHTRVLDVLLRLPPDPAVLGAGDKLVVRQWLAGRVPEAVRLRPKSGSLAPLFRAGIRGAARVRVAAVLFDESATWSEFVEPERLRAAWETTAPSESADLLVWLCLGFEIWRRSLNGGRLC